MQNSTVEKKKLIYYDSKGRRKEHTVSAALYDRILKLFDGNFKGIWRSSGGIGLAVPKAIKFRPLERQDQEAEASLLIWMNCKDFSATGEHPRESSQNRPKLVPLEKILDPFPFLVSPDQRYVVDFGKGIVPVHVIQFVSSEKPMAVFIDASAGRALLGREPRSSETTVQLHWVPSECLRLATTTTPSGVDDMAKALRNYEENYQKRHSGLPSLLRVGTPLEIPPSFDAQALLEKHFSQSLYKKPASESDSTNTVQLSENGLLPFGLLDEGT